MSTWVSSQHKVLYLIICASPVAHHVFEIVSAAQMAGWTICAILTPQAGKFLDRSRLEQQTGRPIRSEYKRPEEPDLFPPADAILVFPLTFNTLNKWALGITDTLAVGVLCEYTGLKKPIVAVPFTGDGLGAHPAFQRSIRMLKRYGAKIVPCEEWKSSYQSTEMLLNELQNAR